MLMKATDFVASQKGVGLIEVLVALLVLSVGLLGLASLQITALKFNQSAFFRTHATILTYDVLDRMRGNLDQALTTTDYTVDYGTTPTAGTNCDAAACTSGAMADFDLNYWKGELAERLPGGDGEISYTVSGNTRIYEIRTHWTDRDGQVQELELESVL